MPVRLAVEESAIGAMLGRYIFPKTETNSSAELLSRLSAAIQSSLCSPTLPACTGESMTALRAQQGPRKYEVSRYDLDTRRHIPHGLGHALPGGTSVSP